MVKAFEPDWVSPPGDTIRDFLRERRMTRREFGERMGLDADAVRALLLGFKRAKIDHKLATKLSHVLGAPPAFWKVRDQQYRADAKLLGIELRND